MDEPQNFYKKIESVYGIIATVNNQLLLWEQNPDSTEEWLLETGEKTKKRLDSLAEVLKDLHTKMTKKR